MARIDGKDAARDAVMNVAQLAAVAAYRAPSVTGRLKLEMEIITAEDQDPIIEFFEKIAPISPVMYFDWQTLKHFRERGESVPILLLGADLTRSELGWDCGACGFESCSDFNKYANKNRSKGLLWGGPTCVWKLMDFSAACDFACAAVGQQRMDCRPMGTVGKAASGVGFMPDASIVIGIPIGPAGDFVYFNRPQNLKAYPSLEKHQEGLMRTSPTHWLAFPGNSNPNIKGSGKWWQTPEFLGREPLSEEQQTFIGETLEDLNSLAEKHGDQVAGWYEKNKKK